MEIEKIIKKIILPLKMAELERYNFNFFFQYYYEILDASSEAKGIFWKKLFKFFKTEKIEIKDFLIHFFKSNFFYFPIVLSNEVKYHRIEFVSQRKEKHTEHLKAAKEWLKSFVTEKRDVLSKIFSLSETYFRSEKVEDFFLRKEVLFPINIEGNSYQLGLLAAFLYFLKFPEYLFPYSVVLTGEVESGDDEIRIIGVEEVKKKYEGLIRENNMAANLPFPYYFVISKDNILDIPKSYEKGKVKIKVVSSLEDLKEFLVQIAEDYQNIFNNVTMLKEMAREIQKVLVSKKEKLKERYFLIEELECYLKGDLEHFRRREFEELLKDLYCYYCFYSSQKEKSLDVFWGPFFAKYIRYSTKYYIPWEKECCHLKEKVDVSVSLVGGTHQAVFFFLLFLENVKKIILVSSKTTLKDAYTIKANYNRLFSNRKVRVEIKILRDENNFDSVLEDLERSISLKKNKSYAFDLTSGKKTMSLAMYEFAKQKLAAKYQIKVFYKTTEYINRKSLLFYEKPYLICGKEKGKERKNGGEKVGTSQ